jgi:DNA-binding MarR family transcriptional regulator
MALERADAVLGSRDSSELTEQARELEQVVQRLLIAEQSEFAEETASFGLTVPQYVTLSAIETFDGGRERMGKIADMARQCSATMTGIIDRLENMALVQRVNNPNDRRSVLVELTREIRRRRLTSVLAQIEPDVRHCVCDVLRHYVTALEQAERNSA